MCTDDFGLSPTGNRAIVDLADKSAISAVSCVVNGPYLKEVPALLACPRDRISLGLHLNFTESAHDGADHLTVYSGLPNCLLRSYLPRLRQPRQIAAEIERQLLCFEAIFAMPPAFVDGHEHVHQLPGIRQALLAVLMRRYGTTVAVRTTVARHYRGFKAKLIEKLGGSALQSLLREHRISSNADFAGVYDFTARVAFEARMIDWLRSIADDGLIMCHPEQPRRGERASARGNEYEFLTSVRWTELLRSLDLKLTPFRASAQNPAHGCS